MWFRPASLRSRTALAADIRSLRTSLPSAPRGISTLLAWTVPPRAAPASSGAPAPERGHSPGHRHRGLGTDGRGASAGPGVGSRRGRPLSSLGPGVPPPPPEPPVAPMVGHLLPRERRVGAQSIVGGLHPEYQLERLAASPEE